MDPIANPYTPGAGTQPPELAGRDDLIERARTIVARTRRCKPVKSIVLIGLRGVGKTVLLDRFRREAEGTGLQVIRIEAPEGRSLPSILAPELRRVLLAISRIERAKSLAGRALRGLAGFAKALKVRYQDIEVALDVESEPGLADNGDLELDLQALFVAVGEAARAADTAIGIFVDELQYVKKPEMAALIAALHRTSQDSLPVVLFGSGLPQLRGRMGDAKSYAERLFEFCEIGALPEDDARLAIEKPAADEGVVFEREAVDRIVASTHGYPYFIQEWSKHAWDAADDSPITLADVRAGEATAIADLDASFFRVRFDRLTPSEKRYLRAMAALGPGPHRSGVIARELGRDVESLGPVRGNLIKKGMVWSPNHGLTAFTVPLFDQFMRRIMPGEEWKEA